MPKTYLFNLCLLFTFSLSVKSQTTLDEYNYLTKGYKIYKETGTDIKKGYQEQLIDVLNSGNRTAVLRAFKKTSNDQIVAYLLIYSYVRNYERVNEYICIPHPDSNEYIKNQFWSQLETSGDTAARLRIISFILSRNLSWK